VTLYKYPLGACLHTYMHAYIHGKPQGVTIGEFVFYEVLWDLIHFLCWGRIWITWPYLYHS